MHYEYDIDKYRYYTIDYNFTYNVSIAAFHQQLNITNKK